jgi:hypothetical protein
MVQIYDRVLWNRSDSCNIKVPLSSDRSYQQRKLLMMMNTSQYLYHLEPYGLPRYHHDRVLWNRLVVQKTIFLNKKLKANCGTTMFNHLLS